MNSDMRELFELLCYECDHNEHCEEADYECPAFNLIYGLKTASDLWGDAKKRLSLLGGE